MSMHLYHDLYRRLYYLPIVAAALLWGGRGGLAAAAAVSLLYLPHVIQRWAELPTQRYDALFEIALYHVTGYFTGVVAATMRRQREALHRADQLRGAGELAAGMAHEVRNPLAGMTAAAERLRRPDLPPAEREALLRIIEKEGGRLDGVVRDFLAYARPSPLVQAPSDLNEIARETLALVASTAERRSVSLTTELATALPRATLDPAKIKRAALNLVLNAVQAAPAGSAVTITTRAADGTIELLVLDRGPGLPPEARATLFTPFHTTREGGTGLWLPVAKQIIEAHGGSLRLEDAPGGGTLAVAELPVAG
jgi:signal transduction histidine kinase